MTAEILFRPTLATILRDRRLASAISGVAALQLILGLFHLPGWVCPFFQGLGIPCPGCGLTRAAVSLFRGDWKQAITMHAFAPVLLIALAIISFCVVAPRNQSAYVAAKTELFERYTGITNVLLFGLILYWLARLLILQTAFVRLIQG